MATAQREASDQLVWWLVVRVLGAVGFAAWGAWALLLVPAFALLSSMLGGLIRDVDKHPRTPQKARMVALVLGFGCAFFTWTGWLGDRGVVLLLLVVIGALSVAVAGLIVRSLAVGVSQTAACLGNFAATVAGADEELARKVGQATAYAATSAVLGELAEGLVGIEDIEVPGVGLVAEAAAHVGDEASRQDR